jgi:hypothetical protein
MSFTVKARYYANDDCFGETFVITSNNFSEDKKFEVGAQVYISQEPMLANGAFKWMRSWLEAYAREHDMNVDEVMDWINNQPMGCG